MPDTPTFEQADALRQLCRWGDAEAQRYGHHLALSLLGSTWERLEADALVDKPASQRTLAEEIRLLMSLAEALQEPRAHEPWCLTRALACAPHPLLTRDLLSRDADWDAYLQIPRYDLCWRRVNIGLHRAHFAKDSPLFAELLAGVSVAAGRQIEIDPSRCAWGALASRFGVLQHLVRGLIGLAPGDCEPAAQLRRAVTHLYIDASADLYKWEREFPVECLPLALNFLSAAGAGSVFRSRSGASTTPCRRSQCVCCVGCPERPGRWTCSIRSTLTKRSRRGRTSLRTKTTGQRPSTATVHRSQTATR